MMRRSLVLAGIALLRPQAAHGPQIPGAEALAALPPAITRVLEDQRQLVIELPPVDVPAATPAGEAMRRTPVYRVDIPMSASIHRYRVEVVDATGTVLPQHVLHHVNLNDPSHRELFAPIMLHIVAASKETPSPSVPWFLFGLPIARGQRFIMSAMVANPDSTALVGARVRIVLDYIPPGRLWPIWNAYPWVMDVKFPIGGPGGSKAFDLPPGRSEHFWESSPAVAGSILGMGGHVHDYAVRLEFRDVTTNKVLWSEAPITTPDGHVTELPLGRFYRFYRLGKHVQPDHRYRVTVTYENPTGKTIPNGGMGAVAGLFVPDRGEQWPLVDRRDPAYREDFWNTLANMSEMGEMYGYHH
jgi:hypothetical protein